MGYPAFIIALGNNEASSSPCLFVAEVLCQYTVRTCHSLFNGAQVNELTYHIPCRRVGNTVHRLEQHILSIMHISAHDVRYF